MELWHQRASDAKRRDPAGGLEMIQSDPEQASESLPTKRDFNPRGADALDAEWAWGNFGGLTLSEAHRSSSSPMLFKRIAA